MKRIRVIALPQSDNRLLWLAFAAALALTLAACDGPQQPPAPITDVEMETETAEPRASVIPDNDITVGKEASSITVVTADEVREAIDAGQGRVTLVNFWATWCPPCVAELPYFAEVYDTYDRENLHFLSVSADHPETIEDAVEPFLEQNEQPYPVLLMDAMPDDITEALDTDFPGNLPVTLVYDAAGNITQRWDREVTVDELTGAIDAAMS